MTRAWPIAVVILATSACRQAAPPAYVRLSGEAPYVIGMPPSGPVMVVFWATWCAPCVRETPSLVELASDPPEGLKIVVLSQDQDAAAIKRFFGGPAPSALNLALDRDRAQAERFGVTTLPAAILIVDGRLLARFGAVQDWSTEGVRALVGRLVASAHSDAERRHR